MEPETKLKLALLELVIVEKANILTLQLGQIHQTLVILCNQQIYSGRDALTSLLSGKFLIISILYLQC